MSDAPNFICDGESTFYACAYGSMFLGCCSNDEPDVCGNGCRQQNSLQPAFIDIQHKSDVENAGMGTCFSDEDHWVVCQDSVNTAFFGCTSSNSQNCPDQYDFRKLGFAQTTDGMEDNDPYPLILLPTTSPATPSSSSSASSSSTSSSTSATTVTTTSEPSPQSTNCTDRSLATSGPCSASPTPLPSILQREPGAIAAGVLAAMGVLFGVISLLVWCCRRHWKRKMIAQASSDSTNNQGTLEFHILVQSGHTDYQIEDATATPAPAYTDTDSKHPPQAPTAPAPTPREIGSSDSPSLSNRRMQPSYISELSTHDNLARVSGVSFMPPSPAQSVGLDGFPARSSYAVPHTAFGNSSHDSLVGRAN